MHKVCAQWVPRLQMLDQKCTQLTTSIINLQLREERYRKFLWQVCGCGGKLGPPLPTWEQISQNSGIGTVETHFLPYAEECSQCSIRGQRDILLGFQGCTVHRLPSERTSYYQGLCNLNSLFMCFHQGYDMVCSGKDSIKTMHFHTDLLWWWLTSILVVFLWLHIYYTYQTLHHLSDLHLFPKLKKEPSGVHFSSASDNDFFDAMTTFFDKDSRTRAPLG